MKVNYVFAAGAIQMKNREAVEQSACETQMAIKDAASKTEDAIKSRQAK